MNKIKLTKLYKGIIGLAKVTSGRKCNFQEYMEIKSDFRYPGELLERMEEKGFTSADDYISVMRGLLQVEKYHTESTFVGAQLEDFLARAKEKAVKEHNLYLLYQVLVFDYEPSGALYEKQLSEEEKKLLKEAVEKSTLEDMFYFLAELVSYNSQYWKPHVVPTTLVQYLLDSRVHFSELRSLNKRDVLADAALFINAIWFSYNLVREQGEMKIRGAFGNDPEIMMTILAFADMYTEPIKKKYENFLIKEECFSYLDVLSLNAGIWYLKEFNTALKNESQIKWWRLLKKWVRELFKSETEITIQQSLYNLITLDMPRKIDGEDITRNFLFNDAKLYIPNVQNSYLLFNLITGDLGERKKGRFGFVLNWEYICVNHPFNVDTEENREWLKGLIAYTYPAESSYRKLSDSVFCDIYAEVLRTDLSENHLKEIEPVMNEIFGVDIKEFLYSNTNFLSNEQVKDLLETGYISTQELYEKNQRFLRKPLGEMDRKFLLDFLKYFCESRKWCFTEREADFLQDVFKDSWPISLAYYNKDKETHFEIFSEEEKELLLGLMCELCIRIPNIADIDDLMAGYIANAETRRIIGQDIADEWYQALKDRDYVGMKPLNEAYLSEETLLALKKQEEELRKKEEKEKFLASVKKKKESILEKINGLSEPESLKVLLDEAPCSVFSLYKVEIVAINEIYKERFMGKKIKLERNPAGELFSYFAKCYGENILSKEELVSYIEDVQEEIINE